MALQSVQYSIHPALQAQNGSESMLLDASGEKAAVIFQAPKTGNLRKVHFRLGTVTTGQTLKASFQDVDTTTGDPDGVVDQSGTVAVADTDDNTWKTVTMGADRAVTKGDWVAAVIEFDSTVGNLNIVRISGNAGSSGAYTDLFTASWTKSLAAGMMAIEYDDASFGVILEVQPMVPTSQNVNTGSTPDEMGIKFTLPFPCKIAGVIWYGELNSPVDLKLYDDDGSTVLESLSVDENIASGAATSSRARSYLFDTEVTYPGNEAWRCTFLPTTAVSFAFKYGALNDATHRGQVPGGTDFQQTERVDAGAWTDTPTKRPYISLILAAVSDGAGGVVGVIGG